MSKARVLLTTAVATAIALPLLVVSASAANGVQLTTPYPAVAVEPGQTAEFELSITAPQPQRVGLSISEAPSDWTATIRGGGFVVDGVFAGREEPPEATVEIDVPSTAQAGEYRVVVQAVSENERAEIPLDLRVEEAVGGSVSLEAEFPTLSGPADATFNFSLTLKNDTPQETTFSLEALGPVGWQLEARPQGEQQASTTTVAAGDSATISVEADPPDTAEAGAYPLQVRAASDDQQVAAELLVEITGNFDVGLTTPDQRLNADVRAGEAEDVAMLVVNEGTAPLVGLELEADAPAEWEVDFQPETVDLLPPGEITEVTATITPSGDAVSGDYVVSITASVPEASSQIDLRTSVKTSRVWGLVGIGLIATTLVALGVVFRRYGRR